MIVTVESMSKDIQDLATYTTESILKYQSEKDKANKELDEGYRGKAEVNETLDNMVKNSNSEIRDRADKLKEKLGKLRTREQAIYSEKERAFTADMKAELEMLDLTMLEGEDLTKYINKYKNTPLAYRHLRNIATKHRNITDFPEIKPEYLERFISKAESDLDYLKAPRFNTQLAVGQAFGGTSLNIKYNGLMEKYDQYPEEYKEL